jgi:putative membrane protein
VLAIRPPVRNLERMIRWGLAALHLVALGIGLGAVWARGRALGGELDPVGLKRAFYADNWWGVAAMLWVATGVVRAFGGFEKGTYYYLHNHIFWAKMALFLAILVLEARPMMVLIRWRRALGRGERPDTHGAPALAQVSFIEAALVVCMVLAATAMARGYGTP